MDRRDQVWEGLLGVAGGLMAEQGVATVSVEQILLAHPLKTLKLPTFLREYASARPKAWTTSAFSPASWSWSSSTASAG